jgi:hypothetical protein
MSKLLLRTGLLSVAILAAMTLPAVAFKKVNIGTRTKEYMMDLCTGAGRQYVEGQGQYGCISNCGNENNTSDACGINCSEKDNQCYGWSPSTKRVVRSDAILGPRRSWFDGGFVAPAASWSALAGAPWSSRPASAGRMN